MLAIRGPDWSGAALTYFACLRKQQGVVMGTSMLIFIVHMASGPCLMKASQQRGQDCTQ